MTNVYNFVRLHVITNPFQYSTCVCYVKICTDVFSCLAPRSGAIFYFFKFAMTFFKVAFNSFQHSYCVCYVKMCTYTSSCCLGAASRRDFF